MIGVLFLLFVVAPLVELYGIIQVASVVGGLNTIGLLILVSVIGAWLVKREGLGVLRRMQQAVEQDRVPHRELVDGCLIVVAGALLLAPGFISDLVAIGLLLPPVRLPVRALVLRNVARRGWAFRVAGSGMPSGGGFGRFRGGTVYDVTGHSGEEPRGPTGPANPDELGR
jgi:UPF0716 protein FxsA